jgi:nucleoside-diphosphate-sugar epimerase
VGLPRLIVSGSSGFVGRHLLAAWQDRFRIFALARRSQRRSGAPVHPNISWYQVDVAERECLGDVFREIAAEGGAETLIHLAAHYDFTGEDHAEYWRTNVEGLRNVLTECGQARIRHFIFPSSLAASDFPRPQGPVNEETPADADHIYAVTKRIGEEIVRGHQGDFKCHIIRFAAMFSDWCEYPPLYVFLRTWLSDAWNRRVLGGRGDSAIPYLHIRDATLFLERVLALRNELAGDSAWIASPNGSVNHLELFEAATRAYYGRPVAPVLMPKFLCRPGMRARDLIGRWAGDRPFERPWMAEFIDRRLDADSTVTQRILHWSPRPRLGISERMKFLVHNLRSFPIEWHQRNLAVMKAPRIRTNLRLHRLLERHHDAIVGRLLETTPAAARDGEIDTLLVHLSRSALAETPLVFASHCAELATEDLRAGRAPSETRDLIESVGRECVTMIGEDPGAAEHHGELERAVTGLVRLGSDAVDERTES